MKIFPVIIIALLPYTRIIAQPTCSSLRNSSPIPINSTATVAAVVSILRSTRRFTAESSAAVISRNGTSASFGPIPISSSKKVSMTPAAVIDVWSTG